MLNIYLYIPCWLWNIFTLSNSYSAFKARPKCPLVCNVCRQIFSFLWVCTSHFPSLFLFLSSLILLFLSFLSPYFCLSSLFPHSSSLILSVFLFLLGAHFLLKYVSHEKLEAMGLLVLPVIVRPSANGWQWSATSLSSVLQGCVILLFSAELMSLGS